jgi:hypothetical protein
MPFATIGGILLSKFDRYKPLHIIGWIPIVIAFGIFSIFKNHSPIAVLVCSQLLFAVGRGLLAGIFLPAMHAPLNESLVAAAAYCYPFRDGKYIMHAYAIPADPIIGKPNSNVIYPFLANIGAHSGLSDATKTSIPLIYWGFSETVAEVSPIDVSLAAGLKWG